jgi:hypothetical protein
VRAVIVVAVLGCAGLLPHSVAADEEALSRAQDRFARGVNTLRSVAESRRLFAEAAGDLEQLREKGVHGAALYLALGNSEALAGRWPRAIWAYECGRQLDPNNHELREHLTHARSLVNYPPDSRGRPTADVWPGWLHRPSTGEWLSAAMIAYSLAWLAGAWWYVRRSTLPLVVTISCSATAIIAGAGWYLDGQRAEYDRLYPLVVVAADNTPLHRGNGPNYPLSPDVPNLPAGLEARVLHERGAWMQVQLLTGEFGWLRSEQVLVVRLQSQS